MRRISTGFESLLLRREGSCPLLDSALLTSALFEQCYFPTVLLFFLEDRGAV